jgi:hypothetical protein
MATRRVEPGQHSADGVPVPPVNGIVLDVRLAPEWIRRTAEQDLGLASEADLRYEFLLGDIVLRAGDVDLSAEWGWVPLLDFIVSLIMALKRLPSTGHEVYEFTESGAELRFYIVNGAVEVRSNYAAGTIRTSYEHLMDVAKDFAGRAIGELRAAVPNLDRNPNFERMVEEVTVG